ncbi:site-2 protease family protein [Halolactibacillus halophilus]|nr:site-2 protease family protein [Halolactibacillus halophilus]
MSIFYGVCLIIGLILGLYAGASEPFYEPFLYNLTIQNGLILVIFILVVLFLAINIHEFGHFVFGKLVGMDLLIYRIGFLEWKKVNGAFRVSVEKMHGYGGLCGMIPNRLGDISNRSFIIYFFGGALFNLISAFLGYMLILHTSGLLQVFLWVFVILSVFLGVSNLFPFKTTTMMMSDGAYIVGLIKGEKAVTDLVEMMNFSAQLQAGVSPGQLNFELVKENDSIHCTLLKHLQALEQLDFNSLKETKAMLGERVDTSDIFTRKSVLNELVVASILLDDHEDVKKWRKVLTHIEKDRDANGYRTKAYLAYYDGDLTLVKEAIDQGRAVLHHYPSLGQQTTEAVLFNYLEKQCLIGSRSKEAVTE